MTTQRSFAKGWPTGRRPVPAAISLAAALLIGGCQTTGIGSALDRANPFTETYEQVDGKLIDDIGKGEWSPPALGEDDSAPKAVVVPDGETMLRTLSDGLVSDQEMNRYLNEVAERLLAHSPITNAPVQIKVTSTESYDAAIAMPDGVIGIPIGMLRDVENEDQLAFVIGHEISHVLLGHHDIEWIGRFQGHLVGMADVGIGTVKGLSEKLPSGTVDTGRVERYARVADLTWQVTRDVFLTSWSRKQEDEADLLGMDLMTAAGYNGTEAIEFFNRYVAWLEQQREKTPPEDDAGAEDDVAAKMGESTSVWDMALAAGETGLQSARARLKERHRDVEARRDSLDEYFAREYEDLELPAVSTESFLARRRQSQDVFDAYSAAKDVSDALDAERMEDARRYSLRAVSGATGRDGAVRLARYRVRLAEKKVAKARENLLIALREPGAGLPVYKRLIESYVAEGDKEGAFEVVRKAWGDLGAIMPLYPFMIYFTAQTGDVRATNELVTGCRIAFREYLERCQEAAAGTLNTKESG